MTYVPASVEEAEFLAAYDASAFPRIEVTVDMTILYGNSIMLIKRGNFPYKGRWALPGGFVNPDESLQDAAERELFEETGVHAKADFCFMADTPGRDPRGRAISAVFSADLDYMPDSKAGDDATEVGWFTLRHLPDSMAFDHRDIIRRMTGV